MKAKSSNKRKSIITLVAADKIKITQVYLRLSLSLNTIYKKDYFEFKKFSALSGVSNSHKEATTQPGAKISL